MNTHQISILGGNDWRDHRQGGQSNGPLAGENIAAEAVALYFVTGNAQMAVLTRVQGLNTKIKDALEQVGGASRIIVNVILLVVVIAIGAFAYVGLHIFLFIAHPSI